jgi:hypothetical protein
MLLLRIQVQSRYSMYVCNVTGIKDKTVTQEECCTSSDASEQIMLVTMHHIDIPSRSVILTNVVKPIQV